MRFYAEPVVFRVGPEVPARWVAQLVADGLVATAYVVGPQGELLGVIEPGALAARGDETAREVMRPAEEVPAIAAGAELAEAVARFQEDPGLRQLAVVEEGRLVGVLPRSAALAAWLPEEDTAEAGGDPQRLLDLILEHAPLALFVVGPSGRITLANAALRAYFGIDPRQAIGRRLEDLFGPLFAEHYLAYRAENLVEEVRRSGQPVYNRERVARDGRVFLVSCIPVPDGGFLVNFADITAQKRMEAELLRSWEEVEAAFALALPNSRVEEKLKSSPEYQDDYDPVTQHIRITRVIPDGTYRHVLNALKVASELKRIGVMETLGIEKDKVVQAMIYHDLGKVQPRLQVGDVVDPKEVFEPSKLHAERSAAFAAGTYVRDEDTLLLIRYHHHDESELPTSFPQRLLPMLRLVQLIDGLSAAVTRKGARLTFAREGSRVRVVEDNPHARYCGTHYVDLFSGQRHFVPARR